MSAPLHLRPATPDDVDAVLAFWRLAAEGTDRVDDRPAVERLLARDPDALVLALVGDEVVGSLISGWDGWRGSLYRLAVHPDHRRAGVARALVEAGEQRLRDLGAFRADAMVLVANTGAHPAWAAYGYAPQEQWRRWVKGLRATLHG